MAVGDITNLGGRSYVVELLASATATNGAPSGGAGLSADVVRNLLGSIPNKLRVCARSTAGSDTMTVSLRLWIRLGGIGWVVAHTLNGGSEIAEMGADTIAYSEAVDVLAGASRFYLEITAIAGTATAVTGYLLVAPADGM